MIAPSSNQNENKLTKTQEDNFKAKNRQKSILSLFLFDFFKNLWYNIFVRKNLNKFN